MRPTKTPPGFESPAVGFEQPFEMLSACHDRVRRTLDLLVRLQGHIAANPVDTQASTAASDVLRYFTLAAPAHHEDEERHIIPVLRQLDEPELTAAAEQMLYDHTKIRGLLKVLVPLLHLVEAGTAPDRGFFAQAVEDFVLIHEDHLKLEEHIAFPCVRSHQQARGGSVIVDMGVEMGARRGIAKPPIAR